MQYNSQPPPERTPEQSTGLPVVVNLPASKPTVTFVLMGVTIGIYLLQVLSGALFGGNDWLLLLGAKINQYILSGQVWRLLTPALLHGSVVHIAFNMYALYSLGRSLERYYGHRRFLLLYAIGAFAGNTLSFLLSQKISVGASTAIFGLVAAEGVFIYRNRALFGARARSMLMNLLLIVAVNLMIGLQPGIDNWGHIGGLVGGALFAWTAGPLLEVQPAIDHYELRDKRTVNEVVWGFLLSAGLATAAVIGRFIAGA